MPLYVLRQGCIDVILLRKYLYNLSNYLHYDSTALDAKKLHPVLIEKLQEIHALFNTPSEVSKLSSEEWLELVASLHFLLKISGLKKDDAANIIRAKKETLSPFIEIALKHLHNKQLLD